MEEPVGGRGQDSSKSKQAKVTDEPPSAATLVSPPGSETPPSNRAKYTDFLPNLDPPKPRTRPGSEPINPDALARALKGFEDTVRHRERTPGTSPSRKRQRVYGDRYALPVPPLRPAISLFP